MKQKQGFGVLFLAAFTAVVYSGARPAMAVAVEETKPVVSCGVPVCDIDAEVARYRAMRNSDVRGGEIKRFRLAQAATTDIPTLNNLAEVGARLKALFVEMKDEDWVGGEADRL